MKTLSKLVVILLLSIVFFSCEESKKGDEKVPLGEYREIGLRGESFGFDVYIVTDVNTHYKYLVVDGSSSVGMIEYVGEDVDSANVLQIVNSNSDWEIYKLTVDKTEYMVADGSECLAITKK